MNKFFILSLSILFSMGVSAKTFDLSTVNKVKSPTGEGTDYTPITPPGPNGIYEAIQDQLAKLKALVNQIDQRENVDVGLLRIAINNLTGRISNAEHIDAGLRVSINDIYRKLNGISRNGADLSRIQRQINSLAAQIRALQHRSVNWANMPAGSQCGSYVMTGGRTNVQVNCQGHNPRNSCPRGFTRQDFGYFEAGGGTRMYRWCSKN